MKPAIFFFLPLILLAGVISCGLLGPTVDEDLLDVVWRMDSLQTPDTNMVDDSLYYLSISFDENFVVRGSDGCAAFSGKYSSKKNGRIQIYEVGVNWIACSSQSSLMPNTYRGILQEDIEAYSIAGDVLILSSSDGSIWVSYTAE